MPTLAQTSREVNWVKKKKTPLKEQEFFTKELAKGLNYLGTSLTGLNHYKVAIELFEEAIPIYKNAGINIGLDGCYINLGNAHYAEGNIKEAIVFYNNGIKVTDETGNLRYRANALMSLGNIYLDLNQIDKALEHLIESRKIALEIDAKISLGTINLNLGNVYLKNNNLDSALNCYHTSLGYCNLLDDFYTMGTTYNNLGEVHLKLN